ncbi:DUF1289 domain-containing protein [Stakelama saccharophila]|uniref:DUF1289 domain-containing protein n=1 Tax=Stakelama saccharophila TaxID=3075605 RepID=A0ABZ0BA55_9SPHN|nr:DUF1289 domain-containing protein [Stakelama sp. W311]WNO53199.1 DUF1289 domain-containing protein [Stakelama sp. W311]
MDDDFLETVPPQQTASPCVWVCTLDTETGWCLGCGRTGDEIARWTSVSDAERRAILARLPARMAKLEAR